MVVCDHVLLIGMNKKDVSLGSLLTPGGKYVRLIGIRSRWFWGGLVAAVGRRPAIAAVDGSRWRYVRDIVSAHFNTKTCVIETMPNRGEVDGGVLPKCNGRRTVRRKIISEGLRFLIDV
jgi:hypothetical protein